MKKLISKVTLIAFIYQTLFMPLVAMEASGPIPQQPTETVVVQIEAAATTTAQIQTHKAKQYRATASTCQPWKRALEYYRLGQYQDIAYAMLLSVFVGLMGIVITEIMAIGLYSLYSYFTHLTPFGEALTGQLSHTPAAAYHQLTTQAPQQHDVMQTAWNMMAGHDNLTKTLFAAAGVLLQGGDISSDAWRLIQTGTKPLQGAFQYLPQDVQSVFFQLCFTPKGHLATLENYPLENPQLITNSDYHDVCDQQHIDVRLAVQRPIPGYLKQKGKSDYPNIAAFTHLSKTHQQLGHPSTQRMLLQNTDKPYAATVDHLLHNTTGLVQTAFVSAMKLRADLCAGNMTATLQEQMQPLKSITMHTDKAYTFFYLWFNTAGQLTRCDYDFSADLEDFDQGTCDFDTTVNFKNDAHVRIAMDRTGSIVISVSKHALLEITPTVPVVTTPTIIEAPSASQSLSKSGSISETTDPCGTVEPTQFVFNTTEGIWDRFAFTERMYVQARSGETWGAEVNGDFDCWTNSRALPLVDAGTMNITCHKGAAPTFSENGQAQCLGGSSSIRVDGKIRGYGWFCNGIGRAMAMAPGTMLNFQPQRSLNPNKLIQYFNVTNTPSAQISHVLGQMHAVLMANVTNPQVQEIVPFYNQLVAHYSNATQTNSGCFSNTQKVLDRTEIAQCLGKLKPYFDHDGFVNASGVVSGVGASSCADGSAMYPLNLDPAQQPYYLWNANGVATPYMNHRIGNMTEASLYYAISQLNATMMTANLPNGVTFDFASGVMNDLLDECTGRDAYPAILSELTIPKGWYKKFGESGLGSECSKDTDRWYQASCDLKKPGNDKKDLCKYNGTSSEVEIVYSGNSVTVRCWANSNSHNTWLSCFDVVNCQGFKGVHSAKYLDFLPIRHGSLTKITIGYFYQVLINGGSGDKLFTDAYYVLHELQTNQTCSAPDYLKKITRSNSTAGVMIL